MLVGRDKESDGPAARMAAKEPVAATELYTADSVPNSEEFDEKWRFLRAKQCVIADLGSSGHL
jgi:hypothetical protein